MSKNARTILATLFFLAFAVSAPAVVLYTKGYRYDWRKTKVEETGILRVESVPSGANVILNGIPTGQTTPASLFRLLPERYDVRLERPGSIPWQKTLEVKSGETTFASGIRLVSDGLPVMQTALDAESAIFNADGSGLVFFRENGDWTEMGIADAMTGETSLLARYGKDKYTAVHASWSPAEGFILFTAKEAGKDVLLLYGTALPHEVHDLGASLPSRIRNTHWWPDDDAQLWIVTDVGIFVATLDFNFAAPQKTEIVGVLDMIADADGRTASLVPQKDGTVTMDLEGKTLATLPAGDYAFLHAAEDRVLLRDLDHGRLMLFNVTAGTSETYPADHLTLAPKAKGWNGMLVWNDYEISSVDAVTGKRTLITRIGTPLRDVRTIPGLPLIAYVTDAGITIIESEDTGGRATYDLSKFGDIGGIGVDAQGSRLLFLGAIGNQRGVYSRGL
jgi:hypothetical protein